MVAFSPDLGAAAFPFGKLIAESILFTRVTNVCVWCTDEESSLAQEIVGRRSRSTGRARARRLVVN